MLGETIGHYRVTARLGAGGMGEVYRATDLKLGREVAVKVLPAQLAADPERLARLEHEARTLAALNHPHIASVHGIERGALIMELVEGLTLAERLKSGPLPPEEVVRIACEIASALEAAHEHGIVHRDLKPANVKLTPDGAVKLLDFGLAKAALGAHDDADPSTSPTLTIAASLPGVILGTAAYMSPEQARGGRVDHRTDIWAFGVLLWEMLTGRQLFQCETVSDTLAAVLKQEPDLAAVPPRFRPLLRRLLERDVHQRLGWIGEARRVLQSPEQSAGLREKRWWVAVALGGILLGALGVQSWHGWSSQPFAALPPRRFTLAPPDLDNLWNQAGAAISPDGRRILYTAGGKAWLQELDQENPRPIPGTEGVYGFFWSPDSTSIGFASQGQLRTLNLGSGVTVSLCPAPGNYWGGAWNPDGSSIVFSLGSVGLAEVPVNGGEPHVRIEPGRELEANYLFPSFLPREAGATWVLAGAGAMLNQRVVLANLRTGEKRVLTRGIAPVYAASGHILYFRPGAGDMTGIWALPFDLRTLKPTGDPVPVALGATAPSVSHDGTLLYQDLYSAQFQVSIRDRTGQQTGKLGLPQTGIFAFAVSPNGSRLATNSLEQGVPAINLQDLARGTSMTLTRGEGAKLYPFWSPDGRQVLYSSNLHGSADLYLQNSDGTGEAQRLTEAPENEHPVDWSRDGRFIVYGFFNRRAGGGDLWYLRRDAQTGNWLAAPLLETPAAHESDCKISPNGQYFAYMSTEAGRTEIYVRPFPQGAGKWQISSGGGTDMRWSQDGKELFYLSGQKVIAVPVSYGTGAGGFSAGSPRELFQVNLPSGVGFTGFAVLGGDRLAFAERVPGSSGGALHLVQNWPAVLFRHR